MSRLDDEAKYADKLATIILEECMENEDDKAFAGSVLTIAMSRLLALLPDDLARQAIDSHAKMVMQLRAELRRQSGTKVQ